MCLLNYILISRVDVFSVAYIFHDRIKLKFVVSKINVPSEHILISFNPYGFTLTKPSDNITDMIIVAKKLKIIY